MKRITALDNQPAVIRDRFTVLQVCVPAAWTNAQIEEWTNKAHPTGLASGWTLVPADSSALGDDPEIVACEDRGGFVHRLLEC